ncbi:MAG: GNAT family N-acetyltransferase [Candidatus Thorarchaeota archaeon]
MVFQIPEEQQKEFFHFFKNHNRRNILATALVRSEAIGFVDNLEHPDIIFFSAKDRSGACFLAGNYNSPKLKEILEEISEKHFVIVPSEDWEPVLKKSWKSFRSFLLTDLSAENLSVEFVRKLIKPLPEDFHLKGMDVETAEYLLQNWPNPEKIRYYGGPDEFVSDTIAFCIKEDENVVSMAAAARSSEQLTASVEIDVQTLQEFRGRGFATTVCAKLIEYCLELGIEPHWDASNELSLKLAQKLGYTNPKQYKAYYYKIS